MTIGALVLLFVSPLFLARDLVNLINYIAITIVAVQGLNILLGYCGQISLGQSAFIAVGAYIAGVLSAKLGFNFLVTLPCAAIGAGVVGAIFALPAARIKGFYIAMATLAAQFIIPALIGHPLAGITGGTNSLVVPVPKIGGLVFNTPEKMFYIIVPLTVLLVFFAKNLVRTGVGRAMIAIRDNDLAAEVMGVNVFRYKMVAFFICALYAGVAGWMWAYWMRALNPDHFTLTDSIWYLGMLIVGGAGSITGGCFGVILLRTLDFYLKKFGMFASGLSAALASAIQGAGLPLLYGLVILVFIIFEPRGLAHMWEKFKSSYRLRPFTY
jgi:branched-chain amino acid transport system permease protein